MIACFYCGKRISLVRQLADPDFCSDDHRARFHKVTRAGFARIVKVEDAPASAPALAEAAAASPPAAAPVPPTPITDNRRGARRGGAAPQAEPVPLRRITENRRQHASTAAPAGFLKLNLDRPATAPASAVPEPMQPLPGAPLRAPAAVAPSARSKAPAPCGQLSGAVSKVSAARFGHTSRAEELPLSARARQLRIAAGIRRQPGLFNIAAGQPLSAAGHPLPLIPDRLRRTKDAAAPKFGAQVLRNGLPQTLAMPKAPGLEDVIDGGIRKLARTVAPAIFGPAGNGARVMPASRPQPVRSGREMAPVFEFANVEQAHRTDRGRIVAAEAAIALAPDVLPQAAHARVGTAAPIAACGPVPLLPAALRVQALGQEMAARVNVAIVLPSREWERASASAQMREPEDQGPAYCELAPTGAFG